MKIMALDLSTKSTGWCLRDEDPKSIKYGTISASSTDVIKRIQKITKELKTILMENQDVNQIILEEVRPENEQYGVGNLHTHKVLMWLQSSIIFMLHDDFPKIEVIYLYPSEWRKSCGIQTGRGIKRESLKIADINFVKETYNIKVNNDDEADAIGIAHAVINKLNNEINWD